MRLVETSLVPSRFVGSDNRWDGAWERGLVETLEVSQVYYYC